jgi:hypothetical protein
VSFDAEAIGRSGEAHRYRVEEEALRAYGDATDDTPGGPAFAIVPRLAHHRAGVAHRRLGRGTRTFIKDRRAELS